MLSHVQEGTVFSVSLMYYNAALKNGLELASVCELLEKSASRGWSFMHEQTSPAGAQ
jgi:hypothetical protein